MHSLAETTGYGRYCNRTGDQKWRVTCGRGSSAWTWEFRADVGVPRGRGSSAWTWKFRVDVEVPRGRGSSAWNCGDRTRQVRDRETGDVVIVFTLRLNSL